jgi:peptide deformylase
MAIRNILQDGDEILGKKSRVVDDFNDRLHVLLDDMHETLLDSGGAGLAAVQVGVLRRAFLILDVPENENENEEDSDSENEEYKIVEMVNPEIVKQKGEISDREGCLSIPGRAGIVMRPETVKVKAQDRFGKHFELVCKGFMARAVCHELDHLNGILYTSIAERMLTKEEMEST